MRKERPARTAPLHRSSLIPHPSSLLSPSSLIPPRVPPGTRACGCSGSGCRGSWDGVFEAMATATAIAVSTKSQITNSNYQYTGSRAGVLFGAGTVVDWRDIVAAGA